MGLFSLFKKTNYIDEAFKDLSLMLTKDDETPVYKKDILDGMLLDFSLDSLKNIDDYLQCIRADEFADEDYMRIVLRCGAYVGEVLRKLSKKEWHWLDHQQASKFAFFLEPNEMELSSAGVLWRKEDNGLVFPLSKIMKFIENGEEDSVYSLVTISLAMENNEI